MEHKLSAGFQAVLQFRVYVDFEMLVDLAASGKTLDVSSWQPGTAQFSEQGIWGLELDNILSNPNHSMIL